MKKMTKAMLMTALILGSVQWGGTPVHASELDTFTLDEYVVTATRTETKLVDTPANISVVTAEQIESRHYTEVADVLKDVSGANVLDKGNGTNEKAILLNGDDRVLVLVDGRRVGYDMGTMNGRSSYDLNQMPDISMIERIEVMKGAGGALYGSDAVGGVVNVITKKANRNFGKVSLAFGSNGAEDMAAMYSFKTDKTGVTVSASKYKQDYYKYRDYKTDTTKRWMAPVDFDDEKVSLKLEQELNEGSNLTIGYDYSKFEGIQNMYADSSSIYPMDKRTDNLYMRYDWTLNNKDKGYLQFYHNEWDYYYSGQLEEKTNGVDLQQAIDVSDKNELVIGASWRESEASSSYEDWNNNYAVTPNYNEEINSKAIFINDTWEFSPSWTLNAGVRYDDHSKAGDETTLSAGLNKKFNDYSHMYFNWGQVFKAPTLDDLYYNWPDAWTVGNPDLVAETGETWTVGYSSRINDRTDVAISYFESELEDAIDWIYDSNYTATYATNVDEQKKKGMELSVNHKLNDNVDLTASYTYVQVKNNMDGQGELKDFNYMPNTYRMGIRYHDAKWDANIWLRTATGGSTASNAHYGYGGTLYPNGKISYLDSSYLTIDLALTYKAAKNLKVFAKGYNLLNEAYCEQAGVDNGYYQTPAQSRRFLIGAEYSF
ncbi:MAG: TonB-dependent receptor [Phascolarctobacterium sp.]|nr:TonB-dependent receptor [Phascolarctobacterium sp.]